MQDEKMVRISVEERGYKSIFGQSEKSRISKLFINR